MDSILGIGSLELLLILVIAMVALGPHRMVKAARSLGRLVRDLKNYSKELTDSLRRELAALEDAQGDAESSPPSRDPCVHPPGEFPSSTPPAVEGCANSKESNP